MKSDVGRVPVDARGRPAEPVDARADVVDAGDARADVARAGAAIVGRVFTSSRHVADIERRETRVGGRRGR